MSDVAAIVTETANGSTLTARYTTVVKNAAAIVGRIRTLGELDVRVIESPADDNWQASGLMLFRGDHGIRGMLMGLVY